MNAYGVNGGPAGFSCNCIGPKPGEPVCPCRMRNVKVINGRYVEQNDLGPVKVIPEGLEEYWKIL